MTNTGIPSTPPGWYPDPSGSPRSRWWNGTQWTETYADATGAPSYEAVGAGQPLRAPEGTSPYTPFVWALAFLPAITLVFDLIYYFVLGGLAADLESAQTGAESGFAAIDLVRGVVTWIVIALTVVLALLDYRALRESGLPKPFHWAWSFFILISAPVYLIGRSVIVRRRTGTGLNPMFVNLGILVVSFILSVIVVVIITSSVFDSVTP